MIPFNRRFVGNDRDKNLSEKLNAELPGILRWAVEGCSQWREKGLGKPKAVSDATKEYRSEQDVLGIFIAERCTLGAEVRESASNLYAAYSSWCDQSGERAVSKRNFGLMLAERPGLRAIQNNGRFWGGIKLALAQTE
jgi:putative DNA primase/helicase